MNVHMTLDHTTPVTIAMSAVLPLDMMREGRVGTTIGATTIDATTTGGMRIAGMMIGATKTVATMIVVMMIVVIR